MKVAIATVQVPFITGGAEIHAQMLRDELIKRDYDAQIVTIPFKWYPTSQLVSSMLMGRQMDLTEVNGEKIDRVIAMKFPAIYTKHENKILWLLHQHRQAYDLWNTQYGDLHNLPDGERTRKFITECDNKYIAEAKRVYTNSKNTSDRLKKYNNIESIPLYHPPLNYEMFNCEQYGDFIFYASRIAPMKRQRLLVEALRFCKTDVKVVIAGKGSESELGYIKRIIDEYHLHEKVKLAGFITEEEKLEYYANCLGVYFGAYDEDYGYITLEGFFAEKPVIVHTDAGGPLEFVVDDDNGFIIDEDAKVLADKMDYLYEHRDEARKMGSRGKRKVVDMHMNWDYIIDQLTK